MTSEPSPALTHQAPDYPVEWLSRVPAQIVMVVAVDRADPVPDCYYSHALWRGEYVCWVDSHGAVSAVLNCGHRVRVKPEEFEVTRFAAMAPPKVRSPDEIRERLAQHRKELETRKAAYPSPYDMTAGKLRSAIDTLEWVLGED